MKIQIPIGISSSSGYGLLQRLQFQDYYCFSEFIDNSLQSFLDNKVELEKIGQKSVTVSIEINNDDKENKFIRITDNAGGINKNKWSEALRLDLPKRKDVSLNEFGVGMKIACLWLGSSFTIETSALGENWKTIVNFDIEKIEKMESEFLESSQVKTENEDINKHYTIITINKLQRTIYGSRNKTIKTHITDVYREFIRSSELTLEYEKNECKCDDFEVLKSPYWDNWKDKIPYNFKSKPPEFEWEKEFHFDMPPPINKAYGKIIVLSKSSKNQSGLVIFRRNRAIAGAGIPDTSEQKDRFRPSEIFGTVSQSRFSRILGLVHVGDMTRTTQTKQILWDDGKGNNLQPIFIEKLKQAIEGDRKKFKKLLDEDKTSEAKIYLPILHHAEQFRIETQKKISDKDKQRIVKEAVDDTIKDVEDNSPSTIEQIIDKDLKEIKISEPYKELDPFQPIHHESIISIPIGKDDWEITVRVNDDKASTDWFYYAEDIDKKSIGVSLTMNHPFTNNFQDADGKSLQAMIRLSAALALSEVVSNQNNLIKEKDKSDYRRGVFNRILHDDLSKLD